MDDMAAAAVANELADGESDPDFKVTRDTYTIAKTNSPVLT